MPRKGWQILELALDCVKEVKKDKRYKVEPLMWHKPEWFADEKNRRCRVCLAGAVMAKFLNTKIDKEYIISDFSPSIRKKLSFLDDLRVGNVFTANDFLLFSNPKNYSKANKNKYFHYNNLYEIFENDFGPDCYANYYRRINSLNISFLKKVLKYLKKHNL